MRGTFSQILFLNYVRNAVYAVAYALEEAINVKCKNKNDKDCPKESINRGDVLEHLKHINFVGKIRGFVF